MLNKSKNDKVMSIQCPALAMVSSDPIVSRGQSHRLFSLPYLSRNHPLPAALKLCSCSLAGAKVLLQRIWGAAVGETGKKAKICSYSLNIRR